MIMDDLERFFFFFFLMLHFKCEDCGAQRAPGELISGELATTLCCTLQRKNCRTSEINKVLCDLKETSTRLQRGQGGSSDPDHVLWESVFVVQVRSK